MKIILIITAALCSLTTYSAALKSNVYFVRVGQKQPGYNSELSIEGKQTAIKLGNYFSRLSKVGNALKFNSTTIKNIKIYTTWEKFNAETAAAIVEGVNKFANKFTASVRNLYVINPRYDLNSHGILIDRYDDTEDKKKLTEMVKADLENKEQLTIYVTSKSVLSGFLFKTVGSKDFPVVFPLFIEKASGKINRIKALEKIKL